MNIFVHIIRHVVVDDVRHVGNIQSSGSDCGGHQDRLSIVDFECLKKGTNSREIIKAAKVMQMPSTLV